MFERKVSTLKIKSNVNHLKNKEQIHCKKEKEKKEKANVWKHFGTNYK